MSYLNNETQEYTSLNNDWDLDAAFFNSSNPFLNIKIELVTDNKLQKTSSKPINFANNNKQDKLIQLPPSTPISTSLSKMTSPELYEEWDVISSNDLQMKNIISKQHQQQSNSPNLNKSKSDTTNNGQKLTNDSFKRSKTYTTNNNPNGKSLMSIWSNQYVSVLHRMFNINSNKPEQHTSLNSSSSNSSNSVSINNSNISINNDTHSINSTNQHQFIESINQIDHSNKAKLPLGENEFKNFLDSDGRVVQMQELRQRIYEGGIDPTKRKELWPILLEIYPNNQMTLFQRNQYVKDKSLEYERLKQKLWYNSHKTIFLLLSKSSNHFLSDNSCDYNNSTSNSDILTNESLIYSLANNIFRDVYRTDRYLRFYSGNSNKNIESLFNILLTYSLLNYGKILYSQEMSDLLSPLLYVLRDEALSYLCFCSLMKRCKMNFDASSESFRIKVKLIEALLYKYDPEFWSYLHMDEETNLSFVYRWLLIECKREFSFNDSLRVLEVMWSTLNPSHYDDDQQNSTKLDLINAFNSYNYDYSNIGRSHSNASSISTRILKQMSSNNHCFDYFNDDYLISNDEDEQDGLIFDSSSVSSKLKKDETKIIKETNEEEKHKEEEEEEAQDKLENSNFLNCFSDKDEEDDDDDSSSSTVSDDEDIINFGKRKFNYFNFNRPRQGRFRCLSLNSASFYNPNVSWNLNEDLNDNEESNRDENEKPPKHLFLQLKEQQLQEKNESKIMNQFRINRIFRRKTSLNEDISTATKIIGNTNCKKLIKKFNHLFNKSVNFNHNMLTKKNKTIINSIRHNRYCKNYNLDESLTRKKRSLSVNCYECILNDKNIKKMTCSYCDLTDLNVNKKAHTNIIKKEVAKPIWMIKNNQKNTKSTMSSSANARFPSLNEHIGSFKQNIKKNSQKIFKFNNLNKKRKKFSNKVCSSPKTSHNKENSIQTENRQDVIRKEPIQIKNEPTSSSTNKSESPTTDKTSSNSSNSSSSAASAFISNTSVLSSSISSSCSTPFLQIKPNTNTNNQQFILRNPFSSHPPPSPNLPINHQSNNFDYDYYNDDEEKLIHDLSKTDNTFLLFICMAIFVENRDHIMKNNIVGNDITCYFDKMKRQQNAKNVLNKARYLYNKLYLSKANVFNYIQHVMEIQNSP